MITLVQWRVDACGMPALLLLLSVLAASSASPQELRITAPSQWRPGESVRVSWTPADSSASYTVYLRDAVAVKHALAIGATNAGTTIAHAVSGHTVEYRVPRCLSVGDDYYISVLSSGGAHGTSKQISVLPVTPTLLHPGLPVQAAVNASCYLLFDVVLNTHRAGHVVVTLRGAPGPPGAIASIRQGAAPTERMYDQRMNLTDATANGTSLAVPFKDPNEFRLFVFVSLSKHPTEWRFSIESRVHYLCRSECSYRGQCVDGECVCDAGFSGETCDSDAGADL